MDRTVVRMVPMAEQREAYALNLSIDDRLRVLESLNARGRACGAGRLRRRRSCPPGADAASRRELCYTRRAMQRLSFYVNHDKPGADAVRDRLAALAVSLGMEVVDRAPEAVVVLGGDGTMLSAVREFPGTPLLGLNLGSLGFLAGVEEPRFADAVHALKSGDFTVSHRTALSVRGRVALNDVVVQRGVTGHMSVIELSVDGHFATRFFADGLVIATPTGSTAYSLAAGGPILLPDSQSLVITPICPHALSSRPLVVRDSARLEIRLGRRPGAEEVDVYADGAVLPETLKTGEALEVGKAGEGVPLVQLFGYDPCEVLNRKLGWSGSAIR